MYSCHVLNCHCLGSTITNGSICTHEINSRLDMAKAAFHKTKIFYQQIWLKFKEETSAVLHLECSLVWCWNCAVLHLEYSLVWCWNCAVLHLKRGFVWCWNLDTSESRSEILESAEMWCWRRMEISWTDRVRNEEVLHGVKEENNTQQTVIRRKANGFGHILRRNCFLEHVIEGKDGGGG